MSHDQMPPEESLPDPAVVRASMLAYYETCGYPEGSDTYNARFDQDLVFYGWSLLAWKIFKNGTSSPFGDPTYQSMDGRYQNMPE